MLATFIPYFTRFSVGLNLKITFSMVYEEKNCCFSTFAQYNPQSGHANSQGLNLARQREGGKKLGR